MRITFVLPGPARRPVGGYRVVYEYADRLAGRGHEVSVLHAVRVPYTPSRWPYLIRYTAHQLLRTARPRWFRFRNRVILKTIPSIEDRHVPDADAVIATWWATAYEVTKLRPACGKKYYLIQHYETWGGPAELVNNSYLLGLRNIVIALWLKETLEQLGARVAAHIPNGINFELFRLYLSPEEREPHSVLWMYHPADWKGPEEGLRALLVAKEAVPDLKATVFSTYPHPAFLPRWVDFVRNPAQRYLVELYNRHAIFLCSSRSEGWSLPPCRGDGLRLCRGGHR